MSNLRLFSLAVFAVTLGISGGATSRRVVSLDEIFQTAEQNSATLRASEAAREEARRDISVARSQRSAVAAVARHQCLARRQLYRRRLHGGRRRGDLRAGHRRRASEPAGGQKQRITRHTPHRRLRLYPAARIAR